MERNLEPAAGPAPRGAWSCAVVAGMSLVRSISALRHRRHPPLAQCAELPRRVKTCRGIACACVPPRAAARDTRLNQPNCRVRLILDSSEARACGRLASFRLTRALPSRAFGLADVPARARAIIDDNGTHVPVPGPGTDRARVRTGGCSGSRLSPRAPRGVADRPDRSSRSSTKRARAGRRSYTAGAGWLTVGVSSR